MICVVVLLIIKLIFDKRLKKERGCMMLSPPIYFLYLLILRSFCEINYVAFA